MIAHDLFGKERHVDDFFADFGAGEIGAGQYRDNSGQRASFGNIDFFYPRVGERTAQHFGPQHVRHGYSTA